MKIDLKNILKTYNTKSKEIKTQELEKGTQNLF